MSLPFAWPAAACLAGMLAAARMPCSPQSALMLSGLPLLLLWRLRGRTFFMPVFTAAFALLSFSWGRLSWDTVPGDVSLWASAEPRNITGIVAGEPEWVGQGSHRGLKMVVRAREVCFLSEGGMRCFRAGGSLRVSLTGAAARAEVYPGDRVLLHGVLKLPKPAAHPDLFDEREWLARRGIRSVMRIYESSGLRVLAGGNPGISQRTVFSLRRYLRSRVSELWHRRDRAWISALLIGDRSGLDPGDKDALFRTGTVHILSISGLHVSLLAGAFGAMLMAMGYSPRSCAFLSVLFSFVYAGVAGGAVPVVRASLMTALVLGGKFFRRPVHLMNAFLAVLTVVLLLDPRSVEDLGARLSFLCVFCLLLLPASLNFQGRWTELGGLSIRQSAVVMAGVFPFIAREFHVITPSVFLANFLAVPLFHAVLVHSFLALALPAFLDPVVRGLAALASGEMELAMRLLHFLAALPGSCFYVRTPSSVQLGMYYGLLLPLLAFCRGSRNLRKITAGFAAALGLAALSYFYTPVRGAFEITLLPLRAGIAAHAVVGGRYHWTVGEDLRFDEKNVETYLRGAGVRRLEGILLTRGKRMPELSLPARRFFYPAGVRLRGDEAVYGREWGRGMRLVMGSRSLEVLSYRRQKAALGFCEVRQCIVWISEVSDPVLQDIREGLAGRVVPAVILERPFRDFEIVKLVRKQLRPACILGKSESAAVKDERSFLNLAQTGTMVLFSKGGKWELRDVRGNHRETLDFSGIQVLQAG